jgi:hypothetical protein
MNSRHRGWAGRTTAPAFLQPRCRDSRTGQGADRNGAQRDAEGRRSSSQRSRRTAFLNSVRFERGSSICAPWEAFGPDEGARERRIPRGIGQALWGAEQPAPPTSPGLPSDQGNSRQLPPVQSRADGPRTLFLQPVTCGFRRPPIRRMRYQSEHDGGATEPGYCVSAVLDRLPDCQCNTSDQGVGRICGLQVRSPCSAWASSRCWSGRGTSRD